jgi:hypothetical protein
MDGEFVSTSQVEGVQISGPPMNNTKGPSRSIKNGVQTF